MTGLFSHGRRRSRTGPVILLAAAVALQLASASPPVRAAGGTLAIANVSVNEPSTGTRSVIFEVVLTRSDADPVTVDYGTLDGTATAGHDYVAVRGTLDFGTAGTTRIVRVPVLGDALDELDETFALRLSGASTGQTQLDATATIGDVDAPPYLSIGHARVAEGDSGATTAGFAVSLSEASGQTVTVDYATSGGTGTGAASSPADFAATTGTLTFNPGDRVKTVRVPVAGDSVDEPPETFSVALSDASGATIGDATGTGTILDDDGAPALSVEDATAAEGRGRLTFQVVLDHPSSQNVTFRVQTADGTGANAARASDDYTALSSTPAQIPAGETSVGIEVALTDDNVHEAAETLSLVLAAEANATLARPTATGTVTDDDSGPDLAVDDAAATEGTLVGDSLVFTVRLSAPAGTAVTVDYATGDGTAVAEAGPSDEPDYTPAAGTLTFQPAQTSKSVAVLVNHDGLAEGDETLALHLSNPSAGVALTRASAAGTIKNDDGAPDELSVSDIAFTEGRDGTAAHLFTVTRTRKAGGGPPAPPVTVQFSTADGSAGAPGDFTARTGVLVFAGSTTTQTISVSVAGDPIDEDDEIFTVTLSKPTNAVIGKGTGTATIRDDDSAPVVSVSPVTIGEGNAVASAGTVEVALSTPSSRTVTVTYAFGGGTAAAGDFIADPPAGTVTFDPGDTVRSLPFSVVGDALDEPDETFGVTISSAVDAEIPGTGGAATGPVTITDDDVPPGLSIADETIDERDGARRTLDFTVLLDAPSGQAVTVTATTADGPAAGGATAPSDYTAVVGRIIAIPAGERVAIVGVPVVDDGAPDSAPGETLTVTLGSPVNATLTDGSATGTIVDDDGPATLAVSGDTPTEGTGGAAKEKARFLVTLSKESDQAVTVNYTTGDPATSPDDYTAAAGALTFEPGQTARTVDVPVDNDNRDEADELLTMKLTGGGPPIDPVRAGATATILDDDGPAVRVADVTVAEGDAGTGDATFTVTLDDPSPQPVTLTYATANGTAAGGPDYTPASGAVELAAGETSRTVTVPVAGDTANEGDEDFFLSLGSPGHATIGNGTARAVVTDDDLSQLDIADAAIVEGDAGTADVTFTVTLSPPASTPVTVAFASGDGTAGAGEDYEAASGRLTFHPGDTVRRVAARVIADTTDTSDETFTVGLSAASTGARLGKAVATATIVDDDGLPAIVAPDITVDEKTGEDTTALFPVRLSGPRSFPVTVRYETLGVPGGTEAAPPAGWRAPPNAASAGTDFTPVSGTLTFAPGDETQPVAVPVHGDSRFEAGEAVILRLSAPGDATLADPEAVATIVDDERPGYLLAATDGGIFTFGGAGFFGSAGDVKLNSPIVGLAPHPSGRGYWLVATDGGIFSFGDARFFGSTGGTRLNKPIVGMAPTPSGDGYWLVATDGGIFSFGDARFRGSTGAVKLNEPIVGMAPSPSGDGYWLVATDGGIFSFGDAGFHGSTGALELNRPVVGMTTL